MPNSPNEGSSSVCSFEYGYTLVEDALLELQLNSMIPWLAVLAVRQMKTLEKLLQNVDLRGQIHGNELEVWSSG